MPTVTLTYVLPDEESEFRTAIDGWKWESVVREMQELFRQKLKYGSNPTPEEYRVWEALNEKIWALVSDHGLAL